MTTAIWKRANHFLGFLAIAILFGLVVFSANVEIRDLDLWLHLKMGELITQNGYVPGVDVLSCRIAGKPWVNHEWLFQVISHLINSRWGAEGLINMQVFVVAFTFLVLLFLGYSREKQVSVVFILLLVMLVYRSRFTIRPDIFSLLFFALYIYILALHIEKKWAIYALFFVQVLWTNFHGFFFLGPFIILVGISSEFLKRRVRLPYEWNTAGRLTDDEYRRLRHIFVAVILTSLVNPMTFKGAWYPISVLFQLPGESKIFFKHIQELQPPFTMATAFSATHYIHYKLLIIISALSFVFNRKKIDIGDFFVWLVFLYVSLVAIRNLVFFAFAAYLVCMTNLSNLSFEDILPIRFSNKKFLYATGIIAKILIILWMLSYGTNIAERAYFDFDRYEMKSEYGGIGKRNYPRKAVDFLIENDIQGNFFNDFNSGAYLIGRCYPEIKVFMDGRTEVYGSKLFEEYQRIWVEGDKELFDRLQEKYSLTGALLNSVQQSIPENSLKMFFEDKDWVLVYLDYDGAIFLKDVPENKKVIKQHKIDFDKWETFKVDLMRLGSKRVTPYINVNRAYTLEALGFKDLALQEVKEALKVSPAYIEPYKLMGKIYGDKEQYLKAFENYRIAAMFSPGDSETRSNLGLSYEKMGDFKGAMRQYRMYIRNNPNSPKGYGMMARAQIKNKDFKNAINNIRKAHSLDRQNVKDLLALGDLAYEQDEFLFAKTVYEMALEIKKETGTLYNKIGLCFLGLGDNIKAKEAFEAGLKEDPENEEIKERLESIL